MMKALPRGAKAAVYSPKKRPDPIPRIMPIKICRYKGSEKGFIGRVIGVFNECYITWGGVECLV